jgi:8-oxo-dGTP diphosphatase
MSIRVAVDVVIFAVSDAALEVLLVRRGAAPFKGRMAIPGSFVRPNESLDQAARREVREETGAGSAYLEQLYSFGDPRRDPRGRVVTVAYYALIPRDRPLGCNGAVWCPVDKLPPLAFDHARILNYALERLRNKLDYTTVGFQLLPRKFTLSELQRVYEVILDRKLDKRNFRKKMDILGILRPLRELRRTGRKPARLYVFAPKKFAKLKDKGILLPF